MRNKNLTLESSNMPKEKYTQDQTNNPQWAYFKVIDRKTNIESKIRKSLGPIKNS